MSRLSVTGWNFGSRRSFWESRGLLRERVSVTEKYGFIDVEKVTVTDAGEKKYNITMMCKWLVRQPQCVILVGVS